jgi:hypothetical protein
MLRNGGRNAEPAAPVGAIHRAAEPRRSLGVQIWYENPSQRGGFNASGGYAMTIEETVRGWKVRFDQRLRGRHSQDRTTPRTLRRVPYRK